MAIVTSGPMVGFSGTIDGVTYSQDKKGRTIASKKNKKRSVPATPNQIKVMDDTSLCSEFMRPLKEFLRVGYALEAITTGQNPNNAMVPELRKNAITGSGTDRYIDCAKVLMTKGNMTSIADAMAERAETGIDFTWSKEIIDKTTHWSDQVVLLAYFPKLGEVRFVSSGPERHTGKASLELTGTKHGDTAEVYISFVSSDRASISNSLYLGQLNW